MKDKELMRLVRNLKLPQGKLVTIIDKRYVWEKSGGYADAIMRRVMDETLDEWKERIWTGHSSPDGNVVGSQKILRWNDWQLTINRSFGVVAADNWFRIELKHKPLEEKL